MGHCGGEAEAGHVAVDRFVVSGGDLVGFMPDTDTAILADRFVKPLPGFPVGLLRRSRKTLQVFCHSPVLDQPDSAAMQNRFAA